MSELKERKDMNPAYEWDLSGLFENDEAFENALKNLKSEIDHIGSYEGKLHTTEAVLDYLKEETELERHLNNVITYASLRNTEDTRDSVAQSMYARANSRLAEVFAKMAFSRPEILANPKEVLDEMVSSGGEFAFLLKDLIREKDHMLSKKEEALLAAFSEVLDASGEISGALMDADMVFESVVDSEGKKHEVTGSNYILLQNSQDRVLRENAFRSLYKGYRQHINTLARTYSTNVKSEITMAKVRGYDSSRAMSMSSDNIPVSVYDNLIETVHAHMDIMYRYLKLRKRLLKLDELHYFDLYAPLAQGDTKSYSYEEATQMVLDAVKPLGEEYVQRVQDAYDQKWIDVYPNKGKAGGAFSSGTYDSLPYIMTNFTGTLESVSTLAHEMGHSQHTWLANHTQPAQYSDYSLFVAEVASTVNENLLIEQLLAKENDPARRMSLLNQYLEGFKGTVFRQTMFAEFEKKAHARAEAGEALDTESLNAIYEDLIHTYFGDDLVFDDEVRYEWARIPHFYRSFYVYVYATGYASASAISSAILSGKKDAVKNYLSFLSLGGSAYPLEELKLGGVDLTTPEPIETALRKFESVIEDAERTADALGL